LFQSELHKLSGIFIGITPNKNSEADIVFEIETTLSSEEYLLKIDNSIEITEGSFRALAVAKTTLLQLVLRDKNGLLFPVLEKKDFPDANYRGLMIDVARRWYSL